jgi:DNA-binding NarL/FixJ family response regulator
MAEPRGPMRRHPSTSQTNAPIRVFLCDDSQPFSAIVRYWLDDHDDIELVGVAHDRTTALERLPGARPDVVLVDTMSPTENPLPLDAVRDAAPAATVVVYTGHSAEAARTFVNGRPDAFLTKREDADHLVDLLRAIATRS